jgi:hypothetical protein
VRDSGKRPLISKLMVGLRLWNGREKPGHNHGSKTNAANDAPSRCWTPIVHGFPILLDKKSDGDFHCWIYFIPSCHSRKANFKDSSSTTWLKGRPPECPAFVSYNKRTGLPEELALVFAR